MNTKLPRRPVNPQLQRALAGLYPAMQARASYDAQLGDGNGNLIVDTSADLVYARVQMTEGITCTVVRCERTLAFYGAYVKVTESPYGDGMFEVIRADPVRSRWFFDGLPNPGSAINTPRHGWVHRWPGPDVVWIEGAQLIPLLTRPQSTPDLTVYLESLIYIYDGTAKVFAGDDLDLSSFVPAEGMKCIVVTYLNKDTNEPGAVAGEAVAVGGGAFPAPPAETALTVADALAVELDPECERSAAFVLRHTTTAITWDEWLADLRPWVGGSSGGSSGGGAPTDAQYVTLATDSALDSERVLTPGDALAGTDGGAGDTYTLDVKTDDTTVEVNGSNQLAAKNTVAQWNASQLQGRAVASDAPDDDDVLAWDSGTSSWVPVSPGAGSCLWHETAANNIDFTVEDDYSLVDIVSYYTTNSDRAVLRLMGAAGTIASPATLSSNKIAGSINFYGYNGSIFSGLLSIEARCLTNSYTYYMPGFLNMYIIRDSDVDYGRMSVFRAEPTAIYINYAAYDVDFIVRGNTNWALIYTDAGNDRVGIGTGSPATSLHLNGALTLDEAATPSDPADGDIVVWRDSDGNLKAKINEGGTTKEVTLINYAAGGVPATADAADVTYTPAAVTDWDSDTDPGDVDEALDQLAERVDDLESTGGGTPDAADVTYTPAVSTDWDSDTDPGDVDNALDQLAERVDDLEASGGGGAQVAVGSFTGDGTDDRAITGVGFSPVAVFIKAMGSSYVQVDRFGSTGDMTFQFNTGSTFANYIQSLDADGFTVGSSPWVNINGSTVYWFAIG